MSFSQIVAGAHDDAAVVAQCRHYFRLELPGRVGVAVLALKDILNAYVVIQDGAPVGLGISSRVSSHK